MNHIFNKLFEKKYLTFNFVGDSVTYGLNHCRNEETFVAKFAMLLARRFPQRSVYRYDGFYETELSSMHHFDGPILVSLGGTEKIDVVKNAIGAIQLYVPLTE